MSPAQAMERSYLALKRMLRRGEFPAGMRLEANRLSAELSVSMTPVRDALHRLVGERMIDGSSGDGFHVPRHSEAQLRALYEWNSALAVIAVRTSPPQEHALPVDPGEALTQADLTSLLFERLAAASPNAEVRAAIAGASDRLHPFRIIEDSVLEPIIGELEELALAGPTQLQAIRRYHQRRIKAVPLILRAQADDRSIISRL